MDGQPRRGGTLRYFGPGGMDHVDPACAYYAFSHQITRLFTRQLFGYPTTVDESALVPVPDVAEVLPTRDNGGLSADRRTYTIRLRPGVCWDTEPHRAVTSADFVRGFKRLCNPVVGAGALHCYTSTIVGMAEFADGYLAAFADTEPTARALADYQNRHDIAGLRALDDRTLRIELLRPTNDMLNILAMFFASPAPVEYDRFVPDSPDWLRGVRSLGPYRLTGYRRGAFLTMARNPAWRADTDPLRKSYVDRIDVRIAPVSDERVRVALATGEADLSWGAPVISPQRVSPDADRHLGYALNPYLVFNFRSPNAGGAVRDRNVRLAVAYAINKAALVKYFDEMNLGTVTEVAHTAIPKGNFGYREYDPYPTPGSQGDPERSRAILADAGYPHGLALRAVYRDDAVHGEIAHAYAADLARAGITVELDLVGKSDDYYRVLQDPARAGAGEWDIAAAAWTPDWFGHNGRAYLQPMFQTNPIPGTANYGDYHSPDVDRMIAAALSEQDDQRAAELWHRIDRRVLADVAIVPMMACEPTITHMTSARVHGALPMPQVDRWLDAANLWLDPVDP